jgi:hypothetical protein
VTQLELLTTAEARVIDDLTANRGDAVTANKFDNRPT